MAWPHSCPVPCHSTAPETRSDVKAHLLPEALALESHQTSAPTGTGKRKTEVLKRDEAQDVQAPTCDPPPRPQPRGVGGHLAAGDLDGQLCWHR